MKSISKWVVMVMILTGLAVPAGAVIVDRIVAVVNDDIVTLSDLNAAFEPYLAKINENYKGAEKGKIISEGRVAVLKRLVDNKLIEQQSKKSGLIIKEEEVMSIIRGMLKQRNIELADFAKTLEKDGLTFEVYKNETKEQILRQRLVRREIFSKIVITDEEIGEYYRAHREEYEGKEAVRFKQILLPISKEERGQTRDALRRDAEDVRKRIVGAESFDAIAAQYAQGPASQTGGDVGFIEKGQTFPEVEAAAFGMAVGDVSQVIESPAGFHIIKVIDKKGAGLKPLTEVRQEIRMKIEDQKMGPRFEQWMEELRKKSHIEMKL
jgi:parvulin-like peptidyl-prolyl isomerase